MIQKKRSIWDLDPRTKLLLVFGEAILVLATSGGETLLYFRLFFAGLPFFLLLTGRKYLTFSVGIALLLMITVMKYAVFLSATGILIIFLRFSVTLVTRFLPAYMMGSYVIKTTKVSEFKAAMEKIHLPDELTIPMCVMFRFFPTVKEEWCSIRNAMKMRGIGLGHRRIDRVLEYRIVPMISCSARIGEELSAAALTRGLGKEKKRTNICQIGFGILDWILMMIIVAMIVYWAMGVVL